MLQLCCFIFLFLRALAVDLQPGLKVADLVRETDLSSQVVRSEWSVELENGGQRPFSEYIIAFEPSRSAHVSFIEAKSAKGDTLKVKPHTVAQWKDETKFFSIALPEPLKPSAKTKLTVKIGFSHVLDPFPAQISQSESQFVVFEDSATVFSPQTVMSQKTTYKLPAGSVQSFTKDASVDPAKQDGQTISYGPYGETAAMQTKAVRLHFENNQPMLTVTRLDRLVEVSHWGNIAIEETIDLVHTGAKLKGPFSRYDFQRDHRTSTPAVKSFKTVLPAATADVYYRDQIGNISTSNLRQHEDAVELEIRPRFPLFGGWKTHYIIGYNVPSYEYVYRAGGNRYILNVRFIDHIFDNFVVDHAELRVILPERTSNIIVRTPYEVKREKDDTMLTYLDTVGRPVVRLSKQNLVDDHIKEIQIEYTFDTTTMAFEPMMVVAAVYILCVVIIIYVRLDFTIAKDAMSESRMKLGGLLDQARTIHEDRANAYDTWTEAIDKARNQRDATVVLSAKKKLEGDFKKWTQDYTDLAAQTKAESPDVAEKLHELQKLDKLIRENLAAWSSGAERLVQGKANKQQYNDVEKTAKTKVDEVRSKMDTLVYGL